MSQAGKLSVGSIPPPGTFVETLTGNSGGPVSPDGVGNINVVGSGGITVDGDPGTNTLTASLTGDVALEFDTDNGVAVPELNVIEILGGPNINTDGATNQVHVNLNTSINQPATNNIMPPNAGSEGWYSLNGNRFMHAYGGVTNTFLGSNAGNNTLTATNIIGIGNNALASVTNLPKGAIAIGNNALSSLSTSIFATSHSNIAIGTNTLQNYVGSPFPFTLVGGNIFMGEDAGRQLTNPNSTVCIGKDSLRTVGDIDVSRGVYIGYIAGTNITTASTSCVAIGYGALSFATNPTNSIVIGVLSGTNVSTENSVLVGNSVARSVPTIRSVCIGFESSNRNTATVNENTDNIFLGYRSGDTQGSSGVLTNFNSNIFIGSSAGARSGTPGSITSNIYIGHQSGMNITANTTSNIYLGSVPYTAENNTLRLGTTGSGTGQQNRAFIAGVAGVTVANTEMVTIDTTTGQLGSQAAPVSSLPWTEINASQTLAINNGYISNGGALLSLELPAVAATGSRIRIGGKGVGLYSITQQAGQTVHFGNTDTTTGAGGSITALNRYDSIELLCITANTDWLVLSCVGNFTIV